MIMCTHKHHVFFLEMTTELSHSDATRFSCKFISDRVPLFTYLKYYFTLLTKSFILFNNWLMAQKDVLWFFRSLGCIATLKACSACFTSSFPLWNLIVSELNLWQAQNKSSNIYSCSGLKHSKASLKLVKHNNLLWFHCTCFSIHQGPAVWLI